MQKSFTLGVIPMIIMDLERMLYLSIDARSCTINTDIYG